MMDPLGIDRPVLEYFAHIRTMGGTFFFINLSELGGPPASAGIGLILALLMYLRRKFAAIAGLAIALGGANAAWIVIKELVNRPRPAVAYASFLEPGSSFPSGHATNAFALATFAGIFLWKHLEGSTRYIAALPLLVAALVGFGRIYLGVHYTTDVLAGAVLGVLFGVLGAWAEAMLLKRRAR